MPEQIRFSDILLCFFMENKFNEPTVDYSSTDELRTVLPMPFDIGNIAFSICHFYDLELLLFSANFEQHLGFTPLDDEEGRAYFFANNWFSN
ncbi:hypothetical protein BH11BAC2_BH11BAC2_19980 [soil metagenome]